MTAPTQSPPREPQTLDGCRCRACGKYTLAPLSHMCAASFQPIDAAPPDPAAEPFKALRDAGWTPASAAPAEPSTSGSSTPCESPVPCTEARLTCPSGLTACGERSDGQPTNRSHSATAAHPTAAPAEPIRAALVELLRVHTGPKLNDEGPSYRAVKAARAALAAPAAPAEPMPELDPRYCHHAWNYGLRYVGCVLHCGKPQPPRQPDAPAPDAPCTHDIGEAGAIAFTEGLCPVCLRDKVNAQARALAAARADAERMRAALVELIACKDLKDLTWRMKRDGKPQEEIDAHAREYAERKFKAWDAASAATKGTT